MLAHAQQEDPRECVGLLFGKGTQVTRRVPLENAAPSPTTRFFADPSALLAALKEADVRGEALLALYHSHPAGPPVPSERDFLEAQYGALHLIVTLTGVRGFRLTGEGFEEVGLELM